MDPQHATSTECLGSSLGPALVEATHGRLSNVQFFRSDWQRGGASTALGTYQSDDGPRPVIVKVPIGYSEYRWMREINALAASDPHIPIPRLYDSGIELGGYDLAWVVMERLGGHPINPGAGAADPQQCALAAQSILHSVAKLQALAQQIKPVEGLSGCTEKADVWERAIASSREAVRRGTFPDAQKWSNRLKEVARSLPALVNCWVHRTPNAWCHGDVHAGNVMLRTPMLLRPSPAVTTSATSPAGVSSAVATGAPGISVPACGPASPASSLGPAPAPTPAPEPTCVLIDLGLMRPGHWLEDALYFERTCWGRTELLGGISPLKVLAAFRRQLGLGCTGDYGLLANVRRILAAGAAPGLFEREGNIHYLRHALGLIERLLPTVR